MKKTICSLALLAASTQAHAFPAPNPSRPVAPNPSLDTLVVPAPIPTRPTRHMCLTLFKAAADGSKAVDDCDMTRRNLMFRKRLLKNGCAAGQVALTSTEIHMKSCSVPAQL